MNVITVASLHDRAMLFADKAMEARRADEKPVERMQLRNAIRWETRAAALAAERSVSMQTIVTLTRSALAMMDRLIEIQSTTRNHSQRLSASPS
jgi:hypothetical protein